MIGANQETFDRVVAGLASQDFERALNSNGMCKYRGGNRKCAIGHLIPDEIYHPGMEGAPFVDILGPLGCTEDLSGPESIAWNWINDLQRAHDTGATPFAMRMKLREFAESNGLTAPAALAG